MIGQYLFYDANLYDVLESRKKEILAEIQVENANYILNVNFSDYCNHMVQKYSLESIVLDETGITVDQQEVRYGNTLGTRVTYFIPFSGASDLFQFRSSTYILNPPNGIVRGQVLELAFDDVNGSAEQIRKEFDGAMTKIKQCISWITNDVKHYNEQLLTLIEEQTKMRREKLLRDQGLVADLGFPIKKRENAPTTYAVPEIKRKINLNLKPQASTEPFKPEPALPMDDYDYILTIIENMAIVMERSPKAFQSMKEEDIRQQFLVQLNGHYEGQATGETFNYEGKTDILVRNQGKNIFIAECKFWDGAKGLLDTITQILSYLSWRDTKAAILLFNRNKDFTNVLEQISRITKTHPNFKSQIQYKSKTGFRFEFSQRDDKNRELFLTIVAFDVPAEIKA